MKIGDFYQNVNPDSAKHYHATAKKIAEKRGDLMQTHNALKEIAWDNFSNSDFQSALTLYKETQQLIEKIAKLPGISNNTIGKMRIASLINMASVYMYMGNYKMATEIQFKALSLLEKNGDKTGLAGCLGNIALVYHYQREYKKSLEYNFRSLALYEELGDIENQAISLGNIGATYQYQTDYKNAFDCFTKSLAKSIECGNLNSQASNYENLGIIYEAQKQNTLAMDYYLKALKINRQIGQKSGETINLHSIGSLYTSLKKFSPAEKYLKQALSIAEKTGSQEDLKTIYSYLSDMYEKSARPALALKYYGMFIQYRDSLLNEENTRASIEHEMKFNYDKKAAADSMFVAEEKKVSQAKLSAAEALLKQKKTQRLALYGGLALMGMFAAFMVNRFRVVKRQKKMIETQKKIVDAQKLEVEEKQKEVLDSIYYSKRIQTALLPSEKYIDRVINELQKR